MCAVSKTGKPSCSISPDTERGSASGKWPSIFIVKEHFLGGPIRTGAWVATALPDIAGDSFFLLPSQSPPLAKDVSVQQVSIMFHATDPHMAPTSRSHNAQQQQSPFACNVVHTLMKKNKRPSKFSAKKASLISLVRLIPFPIFTEFFRITLILAPGKRKSTILDFLPCYVMD